MWIIDRGVGIHVPLGKLNGVAGQDLIKLAITFGLIQVFMDGIDQLCIAFLTQCQGINYVLWAASLWKEGYAFYPNLFRRR